MDEEAALVSIGMPVYKSSYLSRALVSVLGQTYKNLEIIIVNDCSPHDIESIVRKYNDKRIKYYVNGVNIGAKDPARNWNECLKRATGQFFCLLCDDDAYEPTFVEELLRLAEKYPKCNVFHSGVKVFDMNDNVIQVFKKPPEWESCADYIINVAKIRRKQTVSEWMYRREHIIGLGGYDSLPLAWGSDYLSVMRFSVVGGIASTNKELAVFRRSDENITMKQQGQTEMKIYSLFLYRKKLAKLVRGDEALRKKVPLRCIDRIKRNDDRGLLITAAWEEIWLVFRKRKQYDVAIKSIIEAIIIRIIKKIFRCKCGRKGI